MLNEGPEALLAFTQSPSGALVVGHISPDVKDRRRLPVPRYEAVTDLEGPPRAVLDSDVGDHRCGQLSLTSPGPPGAHDLHLLGNQQVEDIDGQQFVSRISRDSLSCTVYPGKVSLPIVGVHHVAGVLENLEQIDGRRRERMGRTWSRVARHTGSRRAGHTRRLGPKAHSKGTPA